MPLTSLTLAVVGTDYPNKGSGPSRRFELAMLKPGDPIELVPEPKNPVDPHAVRVMSERAICIGYVRAERAPFVGNLLRDCRITACVFQAPQKWGASVRIGIDGAPPTLPSVTDDLNEQEPDWYPDEEWPD